MKETARADCRGGLPQMNHFLETCLLLLLTEGSAHGYVLLERLPVFGFADGELNVSTLYRTLRKMEADGLVASDWESGGQGPQRRVYSLADNGRALLCKRIEMIRERRSRMDRIIRAFDQRFPDAGQGPCAEMRQPT